MDIRYLKRENESGQEERFYPVTHAKAIVYGDNDKAIFDNIETHLNDTNNPHGINDKISYALSNYSDDNKANVEHTHAMSDILDFAQSDWNQDDETAPDYIKNRTHYDNRIFTSMRDKSYSASSFGSTNNYISTLNVTIWLSYNYTVSLNGVNHSCSPYLMDDCICLGNASLYDSSKTNTGEEFLIMCCDDGDGGFETDLILSGNYVATIGIVGTIGITEIEGTLKQLDERYIPDTIARTSHTHTANDVGALPIAGGKSNPVINSIYFMGGQGAVSAGDTGAQLYSFPNAADTTNGCFLAITDKNNLNQSVRFVNRVNGEETIYYLYGAHNKPTASDVGAVPTSRTVNGKALSSNITLSASDVGAADSSHNHSASNITSGTLSVARGGTGATTFTSGAALIGAGTGAVTTRAITNNTSSAVCSGSNLTTCDTVNNHTAARLNRTNSVTAANTSYTTHMARAIALVTSAPSSLTNGCISLVY